MRVLHSGWWELEWVILSPVWAVKNSLSYGYPIIVLSLRFCLFVCLFFWPSSVEFYLTYAHMIFYSKTLGNSYVDFWSPFSGFILYLINSSFLGIPEHHSMFSQLSWTTTLYLCSLPCAVLGNCLEAESKYRCRTPIGSSPLRVHIFFLPIV